MLDAAGVDPASQRLIRGAIRAAKGWAGLVLTTHSMTEAEGLCDRIGIFVNGSMHCIGHPQASYAVQCTTVAHDFVKLVTHLIMSLAQLPDYKWLHLRSALLTNLHAVNATTSMQVACCQCNHKHASCMLT